MRRGVDFRKVWINSICWTIYQQRIATGDRNTTNTSAFLSLQPLARRHVPLYFIEYEPSIYQVHLVKLVLSFDSSLLPYRGDHALLMLWCVIKTSKRQDESPLRNCNVVSWQSCGFWFTCFNSCPLDWLCLLGISAEFLILV